jgi:hypothetical protein
MRVGDTVKAVGLAALVLALNVLATAAAITAFTLAATRGATATVEAAAIERVAAWSAPIGGGVLFLAAMIWLGRRRPGRVAWAFAVRAWIAYVILDVASGLIAVPFSAMLTWQMALSMGVALAGALGGAALARLARPPVPA